AEALKLVSDYFTLSWEAFLARYFPQRKEMLERATTEASWHRISDGLSPLQKRIVTERRPQNRLVLAGPGSGKTRLIVHRVAFLVRVMRERPESILVVTFNRHAALDVRRRLRQLIDSDAFGVAVHTYHGLAVRLTGTSLANRDPEPPLDFEKMLADATRLLKGETAADWETPDTLRDRLLQGYRWLLVDEYQDINGPQYEFLSSLAGRTLQDKERKLNLLAVGDDDQNIYEFNGAQVQFIRRFEQDYEAKADFLVENFRSTAHIIAAANALIDGHPARLKQQHPIAINAGRRKEVGGGIWARRDAAVSEGRVQVLDAGISYQTQGWLALQELRRLADLDSGWDWSRAAVIAKWWKVLEPLRAGCELLNISCHFAGQRKNAPPARRLREVARLLRLLDDRRGELITLAELRSLVADLRGDEADSPGNRLVMEFLEDLGSAVDDEALPIAVVLDAAYEFLADADRRSGEGLCLTTAHGAKGLEFDHVVVLDGGWRTTGEEALAERRLYYVAMTRARQTLALCRMAGAGFADELTRLPAVLVRAPALIDQLPAGLSRRFELFGLGDVDMDFAGRDRGPAVRRALAELRNGDELVLEPLSEQARWAVLTRTGQIVGRTSTSYQSSVGRIVTARVAAICARRLKDVRAEWQSRMAVDAWEVVLPELVIEPEG
ncbi:MAG: ATP-dependent helicase, partial [Betaproteobacteria bacterium]|nr:ATP-dependent helicase [Betaproteobacteria bacterium]